MYAGKNVSRKQGKSCMLNRLELKLLIRLCENKLFEMEMHQFFRVADIEDLKDLIRKLRGMLEDATK